MDSSKLAGVLIVSFLMLYQSALQAENFRARIVRVQGEVYVLNSAGEKRQPDKMQFLVKSNETVVTRKNSKAVLQFEDGAMSVLGQKSRLRVEKSGWLSQLGGRVYYVFRKVFGKQKPKQVSTKFATIGIRGTTFIVDTNENSQQLALQEGKLNIESPGEGYEIYKTSEKEDFAAYKQQAKQKQQAMKGEFKQYKKNIAKEFVEYKKSFDLNANRVISFKGNRVDESELDNDWNASFDEFADFSRDYIDAYREMDKSVDDIKN